MSAGLAGKARGAARSVLAARARDVTAEVARRSCVVVAPHPDDETFGCAATMARKAAAGTRVLVVVVSDGSASHRTTVITPVELAGVRRAEAMQAVARLHPAIEVRFLDFPDGDLASHSGEITERLAELLTFESPDEIYAPDLREPPADHAVVAAAVRRARALQATPAVLLEYPIWLWSTWPWTPGASAAQRLAQPLPAILRGHPVRVATGEFLPAKRRAIQAYATQVTQFRADPTWSPLPAEFIKRFVGRYELFFPVGTDPAR